MLSEIADALSKYKTPVRESSVSIFSCIITASQLTVSGIERAFAAVVIEERNPVTTELTVTLTLYFPGSPDTTKQFVFLFTPVFETSSNAIAIAALIANWYYGSRRAL
jgi:hypothetical protein